MNERETKLKKLLYQSWYRGCKETDKIIGGYAKKNIEKMNDYELNELQAILNENDNDLVDWLTGKNAEPERIRSNSVFQKVKKYIPANEV